VTGGNSRVALTAIKKPAPDSPLMVTLHDELCTLAANCQGLFSRVGGVNLFYSQPWFRNYIQHALSGNDQPRIYAVGADRAVLPMCFRKSGTGLFEAKTLSGLANFYSSLFGLIADSDSPDLAEILNLLAAGIAGDPENWDVIDMHPLAPDTLMYSGMVGALRRAGFLVYTYFCFGNWYLQVRGRTYSAYFDSLPSQVRNTVKRKKKQFEKLPASRIVVYRNEETLDEGLRAYQRIYAASWKIPEPFPEFINGLCRTCAAEGWLRLGVAYVDGQPAAAQIWIVTGGIANIYKLAYDERLAKLSLGSILTAHLMQIAIDEDKVREVDYLTGDDAYKKDWMSDRRERWGIVAFNRRTLKGLLAAFRHLSGRAARTGANFLRSFGRATA